MRKITVVLVLLLLAACSSTPKTDSSQVTQPKEATKSSPATADSAAKITPASSSDIPASSSDIEAKRLADEARRLAAELKALQNKSVYFDFDKYVVKPEYMDVIRQQAEFIKARKNDIVTLEGNADERGSGEYNLALGDKRANAARKNLELLGVSATQIRVVSFGEEKPRLSCHEEKCWQENRRDDFIHKLQ